MEFLTRRTSRASLLNSTSGLDAQWADVTGVVLALAVGGTIEGRVTLDGEPLQGSVTLRSAGSNVEHTLSGQDGAFHFEHVRSGEATVRVRVSPGRPDNPVRRSFERAALIRDGEMAKVDVVAVSGNATLEGTVHLNQRQDGAAYPSVRVTLSIGEKLIAIAERTVDTDGTYAIDRLPEGSARVDLGYRISAKLKSEESFTVRLRPGEKTRRDIELSRQKQ